MQVLLPGLLARQGLARHQTLGADEGALPVSLARAVVQLGDKAGDYQILPTNLSVEPLALGIKKGEAGLKKVVDEALRELEASGRAEALYEQWYGQGSTLKLPKRTFKIDSDKVAE